jgi:hypothetical protein
MTATQDLIAAALTAADKLDEFKYSDLQRAATTLREMCARAMVQPVCQQQDGPPEDWQDAPPGNVGHYPMSAPDMAERYRAALIKLSCLGNGDRPGNSEGNEIAIAALRGEVK